MVQQVQTSCSECNQCTGWKCAVRRNASISAITCTPVIINVMTTAMVTYVNISTELIPSGYNLMKLKILNTVVKRCRNP